MVKLILRKSRICLLLIVTTVILLLYTIASLVLVNEDDGNIYLELTRSTTENCTVSQTFYTLPYKFVTPPEGEQNIFFVETWRGCNKMVHLTTRAACAIESASLMNPNWKIYVFFIDVIGYDDSTADLVHRLLVLRNVQIVMTSMEDLGRETPLYEWILQKHFEKSNFLVSHTSDLVRALVLYKYSGTYMDTDIISLKPLNKLGKNYAASEDMFYLAPGFMNYGNDLIGRKMIKMINENLKADWQPEVWTAQGPRLITKIAREICNTIFTTKMTKERCGGFSALPVKEVLAINFYQRDYFFDEQYFKEGLKTIEDSTVTHLWNAFSGATNVSKSKRNLFNYLGTQYCPSVFFLEDEYW